MSEKTPVARCVCGAVKITAVDMQLNVGACHCSTCRRWGGGPLMIVDCGQDISIEGENKVGVFDSSQWADRGFCTCCGTHLFYRIKANQQYLVPAGMFGTDHDFVFDHQVFVDERPDFYCFSNETQDMTGAEVFAMFGAE